MDRFRTISLLLTTFSEAIGLILWLPLVLGGQIVLGHIALALGLFGERVAFAIYARDKGLSSTIKPGVPLPYIGLIAITATEVVIWIGWLALHFAAVDAYGATAGTLIAGIVLFFFMQIEHAGEMAILRGRSIMDYLLSMRTAFFTLIETVGSVIWLLLVLQDQILLGILIILVTLFVEHYIQGSELEPEGTSSTQAPFGI